MTAKRAQPEQALQIAVAAFLRVALRPPTIWTAFPAGGGGRVRGAFLKAMGLQVGWPDILVIEPSRGYPFAKVIGFELKAAKGRASPAQDAMSRAFAAANAAYCLCRSVDEVEEKLRRANIPLHATVSARAG